MWPHGPLVVSSNAYSTNSKCFKIVQYPLLNTKRDKHNLEIYQNLQKGWKIDQKIYN